MIEYAFFMLTSGRSYPFIGATTGAYQDDRMYGRRLTNVTFSDADNALLSYNYTGETAVILGHDYIPGIVVQAVRVNYQWYAISSVNKATSIQVVPSGPDVGTEEHRGCVMTEPILWPYTVEIITTGSYKDELDGMYQLIPQHNGSGQRNSARSFYCVGTDLIRKPGASVTMTAVGIETGGYEYTITVSHSAITTTVYQWTTTNTLYKVSGDDTMPDDVAPLIGGFARMPIWFDLESDDDDITGMYTIWGGYYDTDPGGNWNGTTRNFIHKSDGTRANLTYTGALFGSPIDFRIQITVPSGGAIRYRCDRDDFSTENGSRFTFDLDTNTSSASAPDTITLRRAQTGYCRTVTEQDQL